MDGAIGWKDSCFSASFRNLQFLKDSTATSYSNPRTQSIYNPASWTVLALRLGRNSRFQYGCLLSAPVQVLCKSDSSPTKGQTNKLPLKNFDPILRTATQQDSSCNRVLAHPCLCPTLPQVVQSARLRGRLQHFRSFTAHLPQF